MFICSACGKEIVNEFKMKLISCDGDFVCDEKCKEKWDQEKEAFYNHIAQDEDTFKKWLLGDKYEV